MQERQEKLTILVSSFHDLVFLHSRQSRMNVELSNSCGTEHYRQEHDFKALISKHDIISTEIGKSLAGGKIYKIFKRRMSSPTLADIIATYPISQYRQARLISNHHYYLPAIYPKTKQNA